MMHLLIAASSRRAAATGSLLPASNQWTATSAQTPPADPWLTFVSIEAGYVRPAGYQISFGHDELYKHPSGPPASRMGVVGADPLGLDGGDSYTSGFGRPPQDWSIPSTVRVRLALVPEGQDVKVEGNIVADVTKDFVNYYPLQAEATGNTASAPVGSVVDFLLRTYTEEAGQVEVGAFQGGAPDFSAALAAGATDWSIVDVGGQQYVRLADTAAHGTHQVVVTATDADNPGGVTQTLTATVQDGLSVEIVDLQAIVTTSAPTFSLEFVGGDFDGMTATVTKADAASTPIVVFPLWIADGTIKGLLYSESNAALTYSIVWYNSSDQVIAGETTTAQPAGGVRAQVSATDANGTLGPLDVYDLLASAPGTFSSTTATDPATYDVSALISGGVAPYAYAIVSDATGACTINSSTGVLSITGAAASGDVVVQVTGANTDTVSVTIPVARTQAATGTTPWESGDVVLIGASIFQRAQNGVPGSPDGNEGARWAQVQATFAQVGFTGSLHNRAVGSSRFSDTISQLPGIVDDYPAANALYVIHRSGNDVTDTQPWDGSEQTLFDNGLAGIRDAIPAQADQVNITITKREYGGAVSYVYGAADTQGSAPYNANAVIPFIQANQPDWVDGSNNPLLDGYDWSDLLQPHIADGTHFHPYAEHLFSEWAVYQIAKSRGLFSAPDASAVSGKSLLVSLTNAAWGYNAGTGVNRASPSNYGLKLSDGTAISGLALQVEQWGTFGTDVGTINPAPLVSDARFQSAEMLDRYFYGNATVQQQARPTGTIRFMGLPPGVTGTAKFAGTKAGTSRSVTITHGGTPYELDNSTDAASNEVSIPFTVDGSGEAVFALAVTAGHTHGYVSAIILDFGGAAASPEAVVTGDSVTFTNLPSPTAMTVSVSGDTATFSET